MARKVLPWAVTYPSPNVAVIDIKLTKEGEEHWTLLSTDRHWDNPHSDWDLQLKHLDQVVEREGSIIDAGDLFCAMQGKYDKRSSKSCVRPEHQDSNYLDSLVSTASDFFEPYAHHFASIGNGNHEQSIHQKHETHLLDRMIERLNDRTGSKIAHSKYTGWCVFRFRLSSTKTQVKRLWYMHGYGGGGPVTQDTIQAQRQKVYVENADVMFTGHTHDAWAQNTVRLRLNQEYEVEKRTVWYVKGCTYKDEYGAGEGGWHVETGKPPKPIGAWWLRSYLEGGKVRQQVVFAE